MKLFILLFIIAYLNFGYGLEPIDWKEINSKEGNFSISVPNLPITSEEKTENVNGQKINKGTFTVVGKGIYYSISYYYTSHIPSKTLEGSYKSSVYVFSKEGYVEKESKNITLDKYFGKEFLLISKDGALAIRGRLYNIDNIEYSVLAGSKKENIYSQEINKFLESFKLLKDPSLTYKELFSSAKLLASSVVKIETFDDKGNFIQKGNGFLADNSEVFTLRKLLDKATSAVVTTSSGEIYQVKEIVAEYSEGEIISLRTDKQITSAKILPKALELSKVNDRLIIISNISSTKIAIAQFSTAYPLSKLNQTNQLTLIVNKNISELEQSFQGSPIINTDGKIIGITNSELLIEPSNQNPESTLLYGSSINFLLSENKLNPIQSIKDWLLARSKKEESKQTAVIGIAGGVIANKPITKETVPTDTKETVPTENSNKILPTITYDEESLRNLAIIKIEPEYPVEAKEKNIEGQVIVKILISEQGQILRAQAVSGNKLLQKAALDAAKKWEFKHPTLLSGKEEIPVKVSSQLTFSFNLKSN